MPECYFKAFVTQRAEAAIGNREYSGRRQFCSGTFLLVAAATTTRL